MASGLFIMGTAASAADCPSMLSLISSSLLRHCVQIAKKKNHFVAYSTEASKEYTQNFIREI